MTRFGDFSTLCREVPSYTWCNLFYRQLEHRSDGKSALSGLSTPAKTAPIGVNPECGFAPVGQILPGDHSKSVGNIANIVACALSLIVVLALLVQATRRRAAVCRDEIRYLFALYGLTLVFQIITTGAVLEQGSTGLSAVTAIHAGLVAALFWLLLGNALIATQVVEDGTPAAIVPYLGIAILLFIGTTYVALDTAFGFTTAFRSSPPQDLHDPALFVLTSVWPAFAVFAYFVIMVWIVLGLLREVRPLWYFSLAGALFVLSQLAYFLLSKAVCKGSSHKVDGTFIATVLETASVVVLYLAWQSITEEVWNDDAYYTHDRHHHHHHHR